MVVQAEPTIFPWGHMYGNLKNKYMCLHLKMTQKNSFFKARLGINYILSLNIYFVKK